jgi:Raf kinase inhibitor-like YbhB/YbcL family protein
LIVEDPDAPGDRPFLHWLLWNIPGDADALPGGISREAHPEKLPGAVQGRNGTGSLGWHGPKPPPGHGPHRYHFQIFALSERLDHLDETTSLETLVSALKGLTLASGEAIGVYERADRSLDRPSPGRTGSYGLMAEGPTEAERHAGREGLDEDDLDRHAPHDPEGVVRRST